MNLIGVLDRPTEGQYILDGTTVSTAKDDQLSAIRNKSIGFVFQNFNLIARTNAQKNVESRNFRVRKSVLEYDDVMNKQRTVIYTKRRHALMGERIGMDIANVLWDRVVNIIENNDYEGAKESFFEALKVCKEGNYINDISKAVFDYITARGFLCYFFSLILY